MKSFAKLFGLIVLVAVVGLSMVGCGFLFDNYNQNDNGEEDDSGGTGGTGGTGGSGGTGGNSNGVGSSRDNAKSVTVGYSESHSISLNGEYWFKFAADGNPVIFETTGNVVDTQILVLVGNATGGSVDDYSGEGSNALYSLTSTTSGTTYFIRITA